MFSTMFWSTCKKGNQNLRLMLDDLNWFRVVESVNFWWNCEMLVGSQQRVTSPLSTCHPFLMKRALLVVGLPCRPSLPPGPNTNRNPNNESWSWAEFSINSDPTTRITSINFSSSHPQTLSTSPPPATSVGLRNLRKFCSSSLGLGSKGLRSRRRSGKSGNSQQTSNRNSSRPSNT